jgi:hypothetical protein
MSSGNKETAMIFIEHYFITIMLLLTHECSFVFRANYVKVDAEEAGESTG